MALGDFVSADYGLGLDTSTMDGATGGTDWSSWIQGVAGSVLSYNMATKLAESQAGLNATNYGPGGQNTAGQPTLAGLPSWVIPAALVVVLVLMLRR
jgi:hypothetical protein